jgi:arylsulfatase A-like enzyme
VIVAVTATAAGLRTAGDQGYWAAGYRRLVVDEICSRFDPWALAGLGGALLLAALIAVVGWMRGRPAPSSSRWRGTAVAVLVVVGLLRLAVAVDAWLVGSGPNLVLVSIDTLRADRLGAYGAGLPTSPTIDRRLAGEGVTFERVLSQSPKTTPSHMTLFTSLYPSVHGVHMWDGAAGGEVLNPTAITLAEVLKNAGWATAAFTGGANVHRSRGFDQGFDVYRHSQQLRRATEWMDAHRRRKFFLFFHTYAVHDPYLPEDRLIQMFAPGYQGPLLDSVRQLRDGRRGVAGWEQASARFWKAVDAGDPAAVRFVGRLYDAVIRGMDEAVMAPLLDHLDRLGLAGNTLVVLTSDHGEAFGEHGAFQHDDLYAGTLHVPLVMRFPQHLEAGRRVAEPARLLDVMPTVLDLLGVAAPPAVQGRSLVPLLRGGTFAGEEVVSEFSQPRIGRVFESLRRPDLTYIVDGPVERLFDPTRDSAEDENVAATRPELLAAARADLERWRAACRGPAARFAPSGQASPDADTLERLRALGYVH